MYGTYEQYLYISFLDLNMSNILYVKINVFWYVGMYVYEDLNIYY